MNVTGIRYGLTIQPKQYESERLDLDIIPSEGQTASDAVIEARDFAEQHLRGSQQAKTAPPLAKAAPKPAAPATPAPQKRGRPKKTDFEKALQYACESENLAELIDRFEALRSSPEAKEAGETWDAAITGIKETYRKFDKRLIDTALQNRFIEIGQAEVNRLLHGKQVQA